ncbi:MAG: 5-formyltetrahydrofolate cyclo-ligase [Alphaproteobacteria bacterium]|nr:5-formyltetrahydrofolate cyclo-ligase [Alphaproteobacteria bacterium]
MTLIKVTPKDALRQAVRAQRAELSSNEQHDYAAAFARHFMKSVDVGQKTVAGYSAFRGELDVQPLLTLLASGERMCCLPVTSPPSKQLYFRRWHNNTKMTAGNFGIDVPSPDSETVTPEIIIVPLIAFDAAHHRVGYGAGYYDFTLRALRKSGQKPLVIGAGYSIQRVDTIPAEPHDEPLDMIITEKGVLGKDYT